jgi:hypothetical protein
MDNLFEPVRTKVLAVTINSLGNAVGIKHHEISRTAGQRVLSYSASSNSPSGSPATFTEDASPSRTQTG